jgi:hypothetical protein
MTAEECYAFCASPVRPAILSTVRADGRPHAAPIWYIMGAELAAAYGARNGVPGELLVRVHVTHIAGVKDVAL